MKRSKNLTYWLLFLAASNIIVPVMHLKDYNLYTKVFHLSWWVIPFEIVTSIISLIAIILIWKWKKIGIYLYLGLYFLGNAVAFGTRGFSSATMLISTIGILIFYFLILKNPTGKNFK